MKALRKYLLGLLSEEEKNAIEEQFFTEDEFYEQLRMAEEELIDDFVRGELSRRERSRFEKAFLSQPGQRKKVDFARALHQVVADATKQESPGKASFHHRIQAWLKARWHFFAEQRLATQVAFAVALLLVIVTGVWLANEFKSLRYQVESLESGQMALLKREKQLQLELEQQRALAEQWVAQLRQEQQQRQALEKKLAELPAQPSEMLAFVLEPGLLRGIEGPKKLIIPGKAGVVKLQLLVDTDIPYKSYRAALQTVEGQEVWSQSGVPGQTTDWGQEVVVQVPAIALEENDYLLKLMGLADGGQWEDVGTYYFRVARR